MNNAKDTIFQIKNIEYIKKNLGTEQWVQVSGNKELNGANAAFWCGLVSLNHLESIYDDVGWDISKTKQGIPGFEGNVHGYQYKSNLLNDGFESILYYREFYGIETNYIELSQEFILLNNLRYNTSSKTYCAMYENGDSEEAVRYINNTTIQVNMKFLRNYSAAKQKAIILFFDIRTEFKGKASDYGIDEFNYEHKEGDLFYALWGGEMNHPKYVYSVLMGKKIINPVPIEECGFWPYIKEKKYEEYIIGTDQYGNEIISTCNPNKLNNYFGLNPDAPMYLTPVFFKREVLSKYANKPELYEIRDGYLSCQSLWGIQIDNHHKNCVAVYLGDLGRDLPESEYGHWKSYNILSDEGLSEVSFRRDFCNLFSESNMEDHRFQYKYSFLIQQWHEKYGWDLYLPLSIDDQYNLTQIRIPLLNSQPEFDQLVLALAKVLIDSLNEKQLIIPSNNQDGAKGIAKLEEWLRSKEAIGYELHIAFLKDLQELRSTGSAHRKGKGYDKILRKLCLLELSKIDAFEVLLQNANAFLDYMIITFLN